MPDLFKEIIPSILQKKNNVFLDAPDYSDYIPYVVNKALSYHIDCVLYANEMNIHRNLDKDMQYQYLLNSIRSKKRGYREWQKFKPDPDIECIKKYYNYSDQKAREALLILTNEQVADIKVLMTVGGAK
jgi:hypothetical protein